MSTLTMPAAPVKPARPADHAPATLTSPRTGRTLHRTASGSYASELPVEGEPWAPVEVVTRYGAALILAEIEAESDPVGAADRAWKAGFDLGEAMEPAEMPGFRTEAERVAWLDGYAAGQDKAWADYDRWCEESRRDRERAEEMAELYETIEG